MVAAAVGTGRSEQTKDRAKAAADRPQSEEIEDSTTEFGYPFKRIGRAGITVLRTPVIIGETLKGDRRLISERGFLVREEMIEPVQGDR